jgi:hypothetical protein
MFDYAISMKSNLILKFLLLTACGALFGQFIKSDYEKWHHFGRDAFISYQSHRFDLYMAVPRTASFYIFGSILLTLGLGALYEGTAYAGTKLMAHFLREKHNMEIPQKY